MKDRMLGSGSFGQVFLCHDPETDRNLAVKEVFTLREASKV